MGTWRPATHGAWVVVLALTAVTAMAQPPLVPTVAGQILWPDHDLTRAQVRVFSDPAFRALVDQYGTGGPAGKFVLILDPGDYYLMAVADDNANEKLDEGDGIGFYGVAKFGAEGQQPKAITVTGDAIVGDVNIAITATLGPDGRPVPLADGAAEVEPLPAEFTLSVGGHVAEVPEGLGRPIFLLALTADDHRPAEVLRLRAGEPEFAFALAGGDYHLIALVDATADGRLGPGDLVGAYGVADWGRAPEELPPLELAAEGNTGGLRVPLTGRLGPEGIVSPPDGTGSFQLAVDTLPAVLSGTVAHPGAGLKPVQVRLSRDPGMSQPVASVECEAGPGTFAVCVEPGTYYLTAVLDEDGDGKFGVGDGIGFHGVADLTTGAAPTPVTASNGSLLADLDIRIVARVTTDRGLAPIAAPDNATEE